MGVRSHTLGEESFPPALADDPVRGASGGHHDDHSDEAAGEGDYLQNNGLSQCRIRTGDIQLTWSSSPGQSPEDEALSSE